MNTKTADRELVESLYAKVLTAGGSKDIPADAAGILAEGWASIGNYSGQNKDRTAFVKQVSGFFQLIPDLAWKIEEVLTDGNRYVVRSRATGTPRGPFFGVEPTGKRFDIMTIDIHTVEDGRIARTYHVEDWAGALGQLRG